MTTDVSTTNLKINILTKEQYDSATKNNDELYFIEDSNNNIWLTAVASSAPANPSNGDKYYNTSTKLIYTYANSSWGTGVAPDGASLYIDSSNNYTYVWDGTDLIQVGGGGGGISVNDIDGTTITLNSSDKLQASGTIDKNSGDGVYNWVGTKQEYDLLDTIHNDWIYYITDENETTGNMSLTNMYKRLNRAYAWTYRHVNGAGNLYNIGYNGTSYFSSDAFSATDVIGPEDNSSSVYTIFIICDGKLYRRNVSGTTFTMTQVGTDSTWSAISSSNNAAYAIGINDGNLYYIRNSNPDPTLILKDSGGWQKISASCTAADAKCLGIKNDNLYLLSNFSANSGTITEIDSTGVWTYIVGSSMNSSQYMFGIKDGKLYSIAYNGTVTEISSNVNWKMIGGDCDGTSDTSFTTGICENNLYVIRYNTTALLDNTETWVKCCGQNNDSSFAITQSGKLYTINYSSGIGITLTQVGTDTTWTDISGYGTTSLGINNGNVYLNLRNPTQLTSLGGFTKVYGCIKNTTDVSYGSYWSGSVTEDVHTVYTVPAPQIGFHTYSDDDLTQVSTITAINTNNNTITDGYYTYTRDSSQDTVFNSVSPDSKQQLISMADLLNAIKG